MSALWWIHIIHICPDPLSVRHRIEPQYKLDLGQLWCVSVGLVYPAPLLCRMLGELSVPPSQFFCEPKAALKKKGGFF